jgi:NADP-dependent 3-hydroxy acid dehydrogenase YdfG
MLKAEDVAAAVGFVAGLPPRAHVWELVIKPTVQSFV